MHRPLTVFAAAAFVGALASSAPALAQAERVKSGTLTCDISGGIGLIITSHKDVTCMTLVEDDLHAVGPSTLVAARQEANIIG